MRRDLIIGVILSISLHGLLLGAFNRKAPPKAKVVEEEVKVVQMEMPEIEPEKEDIVEELAEEAPTNQLAPPMLADVPSVSVTAFTQPLQPPPPPGLTAAKGAIAIPVVKPGTKLGQGMKDLFDVANLDQIPVARVQPAPNYPFEMKRAGISGTVTLEFIVDSKGDVVAVQIIRSSQREFEQPAIQAVQKWKFRPGRKGGRAVNTRCQIEIPFTLTDD
ncbi:MAG: energy transducer TonB [Candidatus Didemnitutus sp.]|jgi:protein TonB|nr:energy transducer TonB [Candidatus Didemnitutus sp.]